MAEAFISLATLVRASRASQALAPDAATIASATTVGPAANDAPVAPGMTASVPGNGPGLPMLAHPTVLDELALLRIAASDALRAALERTLAAFADDVLGRELLLAPTDVAALAERAMASFAAYEPVRIRACPTDAGCIAAALPVHADATLGPGDLVVEVRDGAIESTFDLRRDAALAAAAHGAHA